MNGFMKVVEERMKSVNPEQTFQLHHAALNDHSKQTHHVRTPLYNNRFLFILTRQLGVSSSCLIVGQVDSSSEDAADDRDVDFEPESRCKRPRVQPLRSKPGFAAEGFSVSIPFSKCLVNPKNPNQETKHFLECSIGLSWSAYVMNQELALGSGCIVLNDTSIEIQSRSAKKNRAVPTQLFWEDISFIMSTRGENAIRHVVFQNTLGLVYALDIDGFQGNYSKFRS
jgi:hypothetical protein